MFQIPLLPKEVHSLLHHRRHALGDALAVVHHVHADCRARLGFNKFDVNGDGKISSSKLGAIMGSLGHPTMEDELRSMILEVYTDGDGFIDINEVMELNTKGINSADAMQNLKDAFSVYNIDGNGSISAAELFAFTVKKGPWENLAGDGVDLDRKVVAASNPYRIRVVCGRGHELQILITHQHHHPSFIAVIDIKGSWQSQSLTPSILT